jgi:hypothetical protein
MIRDQIANQSMERISIEDMRARENLEWIGVVFFCSGVPALIYQLVWQRFLFTIYGVNVESVTVVVTAFMLGLGIGQPYGRPAVPNRPSTTRAYSGNVGRTVGLLYFVNTLGSAFACFLIHFF